MRTKQELQYKVYYFQGNQKYQDYYQREIGKLDMSYCSKYNQFSQFVR